MSGEFPLRRDNVAVLIPALNEELRIAEVVRGCLQECDTVIVVDDGSTDDTVACLQGLPVTVLRHERRAGKGAALSRERAIKRLAKPAKERLVAEWAEEPL